MEWSSFGIGVAVAAPVLALAVAWMARIRLARARRMAQRAKGQHELAALGSLAAGLAHEIKNPLSTIKLNLQLLCEDFTDRTDDDSRRHGNRLRRLQDEVQRLHDILEDFLKYVGHQELKPSRVDLRQCIEELIDFFRPQAESHHVVLRGLLPPQAVPCDVDVPLLKQAMLNLMINAVQAMAEGGELLLRLSGTARQAQIEVIDTGPGIDPAAMGRIFDAYYSTRPGGTGLGLPTTRRIVHMHGGDIRLDSEQGKGTRFVVTLPLPHEPKAGRDGKALSLLALPAALALTLAAGICPAGQPTPAPTAHRAATSPAVGKAYPRLRPWLDNGQFDYVALMDNLASAGLAPADNAAAGIIQALGVEMLPEQVRTQGLKRLALAGLPHQPWHVSVDEAIEFYEQSWQATHRPPRPATGPGQAQWAEQDAWIARWFTRHGPALDGLVASSHGRGMYWATFAAPDEPGSLTTSISYNWRMLRFGCYCLGLRATQAARQGRHEQACDDLAAIHRLALLCATGPTMLDTLHSLSLEAIAIGVEKDILAQGGLTAQAAERYIHALAAIPELPQPTERMAAGERLIWQDRLLGAMPERPETSPRLDPEGPDIEEEALPGLMSLAGRFYTRLAEINHLGSFAARQAALAGLPGEMVSWHSGTAPRALLAAAQNIANSNADDAGFGDDDIADVVLAMAVTIRGQTRTMVLVTQASAARRMNALAFALSAYRADEGRYADSLEALAPKYLPALPRDAFVDQPFRYRKQGTGYVLYSTGENMRDDGGGEAGINSLDKPILVMP